METLKALNKKQIKEILKNIKEQYGIKNLKLDFIFYKNTKGRIFLLSNEFKNFDHSEVNINSLGMYFANLRSKDVRLSIEGSQLVGPLSKKNIIEIDDSNLRKWLRGEDLLIKKELDGYVLIKNKNDFFGSGKLANNKLLNFIPKERRINVI